MYQHEHTRGERHRPDGPERVSPEVRARLALTRIEQALAGDSGPLDLDLSRLLSALEVPLDDPVPEQQRRFALGWLYWHEGEFARAESLLLGLADARSAYWLARVRLLRGDGEGVADFERQMRSFPGSPRATCRYVDLLRRAGRHEKADRVWKSVRLNPRVAECHEAALIEARARLAAGDLAGTEAALGPEIGDAVCRAERSLLLAWLSLARHRQDDSAVLLDRVEQVLFPMPAIRSWQSLLRRDDGLSLDDLERLPLSEPARAWVRAQRARASGEQAERVLELLRTAEEVPTLGPLVRYARACVGEGDFAALLAGLPGGFLAPRCRLHVTLSRFCRRECPPDEFLAVLQNAANAGYDVRPLAAWQSLAEGLSSSQPASFEATSDEDTTDINRRRVRVETGLQRSAGPERYRLLLRHAEKLRDSPDMVLRRQVAHGLLRHLLEHPPESAEELDAGLAGATQLSESPDLPALCGELLGRPCAPERPGDDPLTRLRYAAHALSRGDEPSLAESLKDLRSEEEVTGPVLCLLTFDAARRGEVDEVVASLRPAGEWRELGEPPALICRALQGMVAAIRSASHPGPSREALHEALAGWLGQWPTAAERPHVRKLLLEAGLALPDPEKADPPPGVDPRLWALRQAGSALAREDAPAALAWVRRAGNPEGLDERLLRAVTEALPHLERLARAGLLARVACFDPGHPLERPANLVGLADLLHDHLAGAEILALAAFDLPAARAGLATLADRPDNPPQLAHHLAILHYRAARRFEEQGRDADAASCWRRSWNGWLTWSRQATDADAAARLLDHLLGLHRARLKELLARAAVSEARPLWEVLQSLPAENNPLLRERLERFRDELATDFLLETREAMRHGAIREGWRADYEQGLSRLRRLMSLDRENRTLLSALVEICADWFLDLYDLRDRPRLRQEVERFTPFALQLVRSGLKADVLGPDDLMTRAALAEFFKFRAFVSDDPDHKRSLYREALALNPANENVRELLDRAEERKP